METVYARIYDCGKNLIYGGRIIDFKSLERIGYG